MSASETALLPLTFVSRWANEGDIETPCFLNPESGEISGITSVEMDEDDVLMDELVIDADLNEYNALYNENTGGYFISPDDLQSLLSRTSTLSMGA